MLKMVLLAVPGILTAQSNWTLLAPLSSPAGSIHVATDLGRQVVWGFGNDAAQPDTWRWDGATWLLMQPTTAPPGRIAHALAMDQARGRLVLFGGVAGFQFLNDTWEFDGVTWRQVLSTTSPPARSQHAMAYDASRGHMVMFGGRQGSVGTTTYTDTWEYDGTNWQLMTPLHSPSDRVESAMAYHLPTGRVVMFGGGIWTPVGPGLYVFNVINDTWEWDGVDWTERFPLHSPPPRAKASMCSNPLGDRIWLFGGCDLIMTPIGGTWEWDGSDWVERLPVASPQDRKDSVMAYDPVRMQPLMYGGIGSQPFLFTDTWIFSGASAGFLSLGGGCPGTNGPAVLRGGAPWIGLPLQLRLDNVPAASLVMILMGLSRTSWNGTPLPLDLGILGMPGCFLLVAPHATVLVPTGTGSAVTTLPIPNLGALSGLSMFFQGLVLDPLANTAGVTLSNAGRGDLAIR